MIVSSARSEPGRHRSFESVTISLVLLAVPLLLLWLGRGSNFADLGGAFSPLFFPTIVLWFWVAVATWGLVLDILDRARSTREPIGLARWAIIGVVTFAMAAFVFAFTRIGFVMSGVAFTLIVLLVLGIRKPVLIVSFALLVPLGLFVLFHHLLGLPLPTSPFSYRV